MGGQWKIRVYVNISHSLLQKNDNIQRKIVSILGQDCLQVSINAFRWSKPSLKAEGWHFEIVRLNTVGWPAVQKQTLKFLVYAGLYVTKFLQQLHIQTERLNIHFVLHMMGLSRRQYQETFLPNPHLSFSGNSHYYKSTVGICLKQQQ